MVKGTQTLKNNNKYVFVSSKFTFNMLFEMQTLMVPVIETEYS
jgi:hypothetical protein